MVYQTNRDLPSEIQSRLSEKVQDFYRIAYNSALHWYGDTDKAHQIAWSAVRTQSFSLNSVIDFQRPSISIV
jgi:cation transport regulator